jgi:phage terminase large subunit-like protein
VTLASKSPPAIEGWPPLYITPVPIDDIRRGDGPEVCRRIEALGSVSKDGFAARAGDPLVLRGWQKQLLYRLFARRPDGRRRHRVGLVGMPRKNGKSSLGSGLALDGLLFDGQGAEVYSAAAEKEQARIVFGETKRMIQANPDLAEATNPMRDVIEVPSSNSIYRVLSAEAYSKEGLNISRALVDELHAHPNDELWNVLTLGSAARIDPLVLAITTAGVMTDSAGYDSICYRLFKYGVDIANGLIDDPSFFFAWWGAPSDADYRDPEVWAAANPAYGDLIDPEDFASSVKRTPEGEFKTKRLNMWVAAKSAWFPDGAWAACEDTEREISPREPVVLGFDGSFNGDSTALVLCTCGEKPHVDVVGVWQKSRGDGDDWVVPIDDVMQLIRQSCKQWKVREIVCDPYRWAMPLQTLAAERLPMVEFPQSPQRMMPATSRFYDAVMNGDITHSGNKDLARHVGNAVLKTDSRGSRLSKETKGSPRKIDLAVAAVMAFDRASQLKKGSCDALGGA